MSPGMLRRLQDHLQAIYRIEAPDIRPFLVDGAAVDELLGGGRRPADEWVLVREQDDGLDLAVYIAEEHLQALERTPDPGAAVDHHFPAFCAATEGISHFLLLVERARRAEPISLLELEVQAEVDKYVCAWLHRPRRERELHRRLFDGASLQPGLSPEERDRYREAGRLAAGFCRWLGRMPHAAALLEALREFWRRPALQRMEQVRRLAA